MQEQQMRADLSNESEAVDKFLAKRKLQDGIFQEPTYGETKGELILHWNISKYDYVLSIEYERATADHEERLRMFMKMPDKQWFSIGFGRDMTDVDMITWFSDGDASYVKDYWSIAKKAPEEDSSQDVSTLFVRKIPASEPGKLDHVAFINYRPLDTGDSAQDYLIQLGQEMDMVYGFRFRSNLWTTHDRRGNFYMTITDQLGRKDDQPSLDDMEVIDGPDTKIEVVPEDEEDDEVTVVPNADEDEEESNIVKLSKCVQHSWDTGNFQLKVCHDDAKQELIFTTEIPDNSWLGIGFDSKMKNADMIVWQSKWGEGTASDLYSFGYSTPVRDSRQDVAYESKFNSNNNRITFVTRRKLDTGDDKSDFLVRMGEDIPMSYAFAKDTVKWGEKHDVWDVWTLKITEEGVFDANLNVRELYRNTLYEQHGLWMWVTWFFLGLALLVTKRYMKKTWKLSHYLHIMLGYTALIITVIMAIRVANFEPMGTLHNAIGSLAVILTVVGSITGSFAAAIMQFYNGDKPWAQKEKVELVARIHRYFGYIMLFVGNVAVMTGVGHYYGDKLKGDERRVLGIFSMLVFCILVVVFEAIHRIRNRYSMGMIQTPDSKSKAKTYTPEQISALVNEGSKLVIFDNLVLDLNGFERIHPGGKFNLMHNLGRDISKFFFGGYSLINKSGKRPHTHSQAALDIVQSLIVGVIKSQEHTQDELFKITRKVPVNAETATFTFTSIDDQPVTNIKQWYQDPAMMGRHFLVFSVTDPTVKRHYTICSAMQPTLKQELLDLAHSLLKNKTLQGDISQLSTKDTNQVSLTLKTYRMNRGLSTRIHSTPFEEENLKTTNSETPLEVMPADNAYYIKGPMGKGLQLQSTGVHVAFCAGTGALVFLDLVASLLIKNCFDKDGRKLPKGIDFFEQGFQFHFYCSFRDRETAIGLELIEALQKVCEHLNLTNFKATVRLSKVDDGGPRPPSWTAPYIEDELTPIEGKIERVWVCGPPAMNELFDQTLASLRQKLMLQRSQIEIM